jgi:ecotin
MKNPLVFIPILALALLIVSCGSRRTVSGNENVQEIDAQEVVATPRSIEGFVPNMIILSGREDESLFKVEILAGKEMEIDCNTHILMGEFEERMTDMGETHLIFNSNGHTISTMMACLDDTRHLTFVTAQPHFVRYNSASPLVVHTPQGISARHRVWQAGETQPITLALAAIYNEATQALNAFPTEKEGYVRHVLLLPEINDSRERKVEIIPGKIAEVDCNRHILSGAISSVTIDGWGYDYLVFDSNGTIASTRMACAEPPTLEFVYGQTEFVRYNSRLPIVVFAPAGFEVRYRIWEAPSM